MVRNESTGEIEQKNYDVTDGLMQKPADNTDYLDNHTQSFYFKNSANHIAIKNKLFSYIVRICIEPFDNRSKITDFKGEYRFKGFPFRVSNSVNSHPGLSTSRVVMSGKVANEATAAEVGAQRVGGAFGKGAQMGDKRTGTGAGVERSPTGNSTTGTGGYGTFDLAGRSIGAGGLPRPVYNVQKEGKVVVTITVNPKGEVIATSINRLTNTVNPTLRKAAENAAKKARFNAVDGVNNQTGTITYFFNLK